MKLIIEKMFDDAQTPSKEHVRSSGFDLYVHRFIKHYEHDGDIERCVDVPASAKTLDLNKNERVMIGTGIKACVDFSKTDMQSFCSLHDMTWELQVRARSGTALKRGLMVTNGIGTVDCVVKGTLISTPSGDVPIEVLMEQAGKCDVYSYNEITDSIDVDTMSDIWIVEDQNIIRIELETGKTVQLSENKTVLTSVGWVKACELTTSHEILCID